MLGVVLVHPDDKRVFALAPEPILKPDGKKKNDCERNAAKRLLTGRFLSDWAAAAPATVETTLTDPQGFRHRFRYLNCAPLNESNFAPQVHFLEYRERAPDGTLTHFAWVTEIPISEHNPMPLMRGARARWKIENEAFNTLKTQGYHFEHDFGHGHQRLSTLLMHPMMLAFLSTRLRPLVTFHLVMNRH